MLNIKQLVYNFKIDILRILKGTKLAWFWGLPAGHVFGVVVAYC